MDALVKFRKGLLDFPMIFLFNNLPFYRGHLEKNHFFVQTGLITKPYRPQSPSTFGDHFYSILNAEYNIYNMYFRSVMLFNFKFLTAQYFVKVKCKHSFVSLMFTKNVIKENRTLYECVFLIALYLVPTIHGSHCSFVLPSYFPTFCFRLLSLHIAFLVCFFSFLKI